MRIFDTLNINKLLIGVTAAFNASRKPARPPGDAKALIGMSPLIQETFFTVAHRPMTQPLKFFRNTAGKKA